MRLQLSDITTNWTLFLDRDGVINHEKYNDYINTWDEFNFYEDVLQALAQLAGRFRYIIVVTNQKGVGKGITRQEDLFTIHRTMIQKIVETGGRIDAVYFCPDLDDDSPNRKPNPGMGLQAINDFPEIDPAQSLMVGNTLSDMEFGRRLGTAINVFIKSTRPDTDPTDNRIDFCFNSLPEFANALAKF